MLAGAVVFAAVISLSLHWRLSSVADRQAEVERIIKPDPETMTTTYVDNTGTTRTVTTTRNPGETIQSWADRHAQDIVEMMDQYPPAE